MKRNRVQGLATLLTNGYLKGFVEGKIFKGASKSLCVPGLNCYSCPGALGSCPIGSLQAVIGSMKYQWSFYVIGTMMLYGTLFGRLICGWLCPFGWIQDLLGKTGIQKRQVPKWMKKIKYFVLLYFVILFPMLFTNAVGIGDPGFCKYICPSGTLLGAFPLLFKNPSLRAALGILFSWKVGLLIAILSLSLVYVRFFCKTLCPLGAFYSFFNKVSVYKYEVDYIGCSSCGHCKSVCPMDVVPFESPNDLECIRCGECISACPTQAIKRKNCLKKVSVEDEK